MLAESGPKYIWPYLYVEAIDGSAAHLSEETEAIHTWLKEQPEPVKVGDISKRFGIETYNDMREKMTYRLIGNPVEELVHHGLARVVKGAK
jgi:hypothetical protein